MALSPIGKDKPSYFEATILHTGTAATNAVGVGFAWGAGPHNQARMVGWDAALIGLHSDDGGIYAGTDVAGSATVVSPSFHREGAVLGMGMMPPAAPGGKWKMIATVNDREVYTKDMPGAVDLKHIQFGVSLLGEDVLVAVNTGDRGFMYRPANAMRKHVPYVSLPILREAKAKLDALMAESGHGVHKATAAAAVDALEAALAAVRAVEHEL